jgi:hypothetical protein
MYEIAIYRFTTTLWRWEVRCGGAVIRCGTAHSKIEAQSEVDEIVHA